jgi:hypothetical protein
MLDTISSHLPDGIALCHQNANLVEVVSTVTILLLELKSLVIYLYPPGILLHLLLNLDLLFISNDSNPQFDAKPLVRL